MINPAIESNTTKNQVAEALRNGGVGVLATDTIYGLVGRAEDKAAVERIYELKQRDPSKPCLILIADVTDLLAFNIELTDFQRQNIDQHWPGPVSIILDCPDDELDYLHRGTKSLGFRLPADHALRDSIRRTGPLVAPSANPEDQPPAKTIDEAKEYFGDSVGFYSEGPVSETPSKIIRLTDDMVEVIRS